MAVGRLCFAAVLMALALTGCETSAEKSAQLEKAAKHLVGAAAKGLTIAKTSTDVRVLATEVLHDSEGTAAVVTLRNRSTHALTDVPIAITVRDAAGRVLYRNDSPGLEAALTTVALLAPGGQFTWIDDQVQAGGTPASVSARIGEADRASAGAPPIHVSNVHANEEAGGFGVAGSVANDSSITQHDVVVYGIARRGNRIVAAGRAVLTEVPTHGSLPFQVLFIGDARGAHVEASAPPTSF